MFAWLQAAGPSSVPTQGATNSSPSVMRVAAGRGRFSDSTPQRLNDPWLRRMAALTTVALCGFMTPLAGASVTSSASGPAGAAHAAQVSGTAAQGAAAHSSVSRPAASLASNDGQSKPVNLEGGDLSIFDAVATANGEVDLQLKDGATGTSHNPAQTTLKIPASTWQNISDDYPGSPGGYFVSQGVQANSPLQPASAAPKGRLGWDTSQLAQAGFSAAHFEVSYSGPEGASVSLFGLDDNGQLASSLLVDGNYELNPLGSEIAPQQLAAAYPNWVFSAAGVYQLQVRVLAQRNDGTVIASPVRSYRVEVGDVAAQATPTPAPTEQNPDTQKPGAQPTAAPSAVPSAAPSAVPQPVVTPSAQPSTAPSAQPGVSAAPSAPANPVANPKPVTSTPATSPSPRSAIGGEVKAKPSAANPAGKQLLASSRSAKSAQAPRAAAQGRSASQARAAVGQSRSAVTTRAGAQSFVSQARPAQSFVAQARSVSQGAAAQTSAQKAKAQSAAAVKENPASSAVSATATLTFVVGPDANGNANEGHFDLGPRIVDGKLKLQVKDDRSQPASWVDPATLTFSLGDKATLKAPDALNFVATPGQDVWMISSSQSAGVPWLGMNSQAEEIVSKTSGEVTFTLVSVEGPGKVSVFTSGGLGGGVGEHLLQEEGSSYTLPANTHAHQNWVFTAPGTYKLTISAQVTPKQGEQISGEDGGSGDGAAASSGAGSSEGGSASGAAGSAASGSAKAGQAAGASGGKSLAKTGAVSGALNVAGGLMLLAVAVLVARRRMAWA
ncbi:MAG: choice-of-anchor M domain-containing protein [Actinomyces graevenitzii]|uniref:Choice-of-anchor M domain-containing protein n=1 Tax=Actinomyces graevenitzii TaxID=55565 RepID=A0A9E7DD60_9ACTO|nr:MAG: choice-of-anchor M domain-containing protein [Actinomyces graevenitzii]